jgi:GGDEF domain-containing protein
VQLSCGCVRSPELPTGPILSPAGKLPLDTFSPSERRSDFNAAPPGQRAFGRIENGLRTDQGKPSISVSIGVGTYPDDGLTAPELIEAADQQLYKYKRTENGRTTSAQAQLSRTKRASR